MTTGKEGDQILKQVHRLVALYRLEKARKAAKVKKGKIVKIQPKK